MAFPVAVALGAISALGGVLGSKGRKEIDPEVLKRLFGPEAVTKDTLDFYNNLINSPQGAAMLNNASVVGANVANQINARAAESGIAGGGGESGVGSFGVAAGGSAGNLLKNNIRGQVYGQALEAAINNNAQRMSIYGQSALQRQQTPTFAQALGAGLQAGAGAIAAGLPAGNGAPSAAPEARDYTQASNSIMSTAPQYGQKPSAFSNAYLRAPAGLGEGNFSYNSFRKPKSIPQYRF